MSAEMSAGASFDAPNRVLARAAQKMTLTSLMRLAYNRANQFRYADPRSRWTRTVRTIACNRPNRHDPAARS
jgi:hypothetical protein